MSETKRSPKRRDKKGRVLRNGESQRTDGRYAFVYTDCFGKQKFLYSWKLEPTDPLPAGRRPCKSLREKEKDILKDIDDSVTREAITRKQERAFLEFVKNDKHFCKYYEGIYILFKTGLRISEFVGLQKSDIDFDENTIRIDHQLQRKRDMEYIIEGTKTLNGERVLPMTKEVRECFEVIISRRRKPKVEPTVRDKNGKLYHGFLYLDQNDMPMVALHWEKYFQHILTKYNSIYKEELPKITPHVCRHTYCSNMAKSGMNPKTLQYLMGHSDIGVTLNTYTHLGLDDAKEEVERIAAMA